MQLTMVRHGEPARGLSPEEQFDPPLSALGRRHAELAAGFLADEPHTALYVSPLRRARQTAEPVAAALRLEPVVVPELAEFDASVGYTHFEDLRAAGDPRYHAFLAGDLSPWGTDADTFRATVLGAIDAIAARHPDGRVAVVSHGGVHNVFLGAVLGLPALSFHRPDYGSVTRVEIGPHRRVVSINETGHLRSPERAPWPPEF